MALGIFAVVGTVIVLPMLYPDGRLPCPRWRPAAWASWATVALGLAFSSRLAGYARPSGRDPIVVYEIDNPVGAAWADRIDAVFEQVDTLVFIVVLFVAVSAAVVGFWRSTGAERQQMKWLLLAVVAVLGGVYVTGVVLLGAFVSALTGQEGGDMAVAASTLAAVALFRPVRTRIQGAVDRRFNRTGFQARRAVEAFPDRVRDEVALEAIRAEVVHSATTSVEPELVWIWTGPGERRP